jgi:hypothetical protein
MIIKLLNLKCYDYKYIAYPKGVYDSFVDITYIITITDSPRSKEIYEKLKKFNPTSTICIVYNKGYKKCNKILMKQNSGFDLSNAYFNIFYHSIKKNYNNIMILEDDFEFDYKLNNDPVVMNDLKTFFDQRIKESFMYNLGPFSQLCNPFVTSSLNHYKVLYATNTQGLIYTKKVRYESLRYFFTVSNQELMSFDGFICKYFTMYFYKYPLCYQLFPVTENSELWGNIFLRLIFKVTNLEKKAKPGYPLLFYSMIIVSYLFFIAFSIFLVILFGLILYVLITHKSPQFNYNIKWWR